MIKPHNIPIFVIHQHVHKTYHYPESNTPIEHQVHHCHHHGIIDNAPRKNWDSCCCMYPGHHAEMHPYRHNPHHGNLDGPENRSFLFPPAICVPCNTDHALKHYSHTCNCYDGLGNYYPDERCQRASSYFTAQRNARTYIISDCHNRCSAGSPIQQSGKPHGGGNHDLVRSLFH